MGIKVTFAYTGQLAGAAGIAEEVIELDVGTSLAAALAKLTAKYGGKFADLLVDDSGRPRSTLLVALNDEQVRENYAEVILSDGANLMLMTPIAGG